MKLSGPVDQPSWTQSTAPWTYSTAFSIEK
jgi:hypothetical protein